MDEIWGFGSVCTPGYMVKIRITFTMKLQCVLFWPSTNYDLMCGTFIVWLHSRLKSLKNFQRLFPFFLLLMIGLKKLFNVMKWRIMKWVCLVCRALRLVIAIWKWKLPSLLSCQDPMCSHWFGRGVFCRTFIFFPQFKMAFLFYPFSP